MHERTHDGRAFRLLTLLDEYTRESLTIEVQRQMNHQDVLDRLAELFVDRGVPEYIRSDNGLEFTAQAVRDWLKSVGVRTLYWRCTFCCLGRDDRRDREICGQSDAVGGLLRW